MVFTRLTLIYPGRFLSIANEIEDRDKKDALIRAIKCEWAEDKQLQGIDMELATAAVEVCKTKVYPPNCPADFVEAVRQVREERRQEQERQERKRQMATRLPPPESEAERRVRLGAAIAARVRTENPDKPWGELQSLINQAIKAEMKNV